MRWNIIRLDTTMEGKTKSPKKSYPNRLGFYGLVIEQLFKHSKNKRTISNRLKQQKQIVTTQTWSFFLYFTFIHFLLKYSKMWLNK